MSVPALIFFILFGISSVINIVFAFFECEKGRVITKPLCLLFLAIAAIICAPDKPLIYLGAIFGWIGDILLIPKNKFKVFALGALSFLIGHILYLTQMILLLSYQPPYYAYVIGTICVLILSFVIYKVFKDKAGKPAILGGFYLSTVTLCVVTSVFLLVDKSAIPLGAILITIGYIFFLSSDTMIGICRFMIPIKRSHFYIMTTYLIAQLLIVLGFLYLL